MTTLPTIPHATPDHEIKRLVAEFFRVHGDDLISEAMDDSVSDDSVGFQLRRMWWEHVRREREALK